MEIKRNGSQPSTKGAEQYFTGSVRIDPIIEAPAPARVRSGRVTFEPGARTAWHTHPNGQTIFVLEGAGLCQRRGGPIEAIRPGDRVFFEPGEEHWHGAAPDRFMIHVAIVQVDDAGTPANWLEHVTDEEYAGG